MIGLMSGTSADGVDAALVEWPRGAECRPFRLLAFAEQPFPAGLQQRIHALAAGRLGSDRLLEELAALDVELGERFAQAALDLLRESGTAAQTVDAIASHGQTVAHHPQRRATLQLGDPSVISERSGLLTIADFRSRDLAAGGEGAPLAPFFHWATCHVSGENRLVLNLGGIANLTWLPSDCGAAGERVQAFDVGPANCLLDGVVQRASGGAERCDRDGRRASGGRVDAALLARLLDDDFLRRAPPKSTGRERYGWAEAESLYEETLQSGRTLDDLLATLVAFTAEAVVRACDVFLAGAAAVQRLIVCGGGARNPALMRALAERLPQARVEPSDAVGIPSQAVEAMAFSLLGRNALLGLPNHLPHCTGARRACVLGELAGGLQPLQLRLGNNGVGSGA